jgi:hypothetical protein
VIDEDAQRLYEVLVAIVNSGMTGLLSAVTEARNRTPWEETRVKTRDAMRALAVKLTVRPPKA